jgi:translation initiation factor 1
MSKKNTPDKRGFVYSTDPNFQFDEESGPAAKTLPPALQKLRVKLETKHRGGKAVTSIENFIGTEEDAIALGKSLKNFCGTGGSVKGSEILVQGDQRDKVLQWLLKNDYKNSKKI